jgi:hypothetical protein
VDYTPLKIDHQIKAGATSFAVVSEVAETHRVRFKALKVPFRNVQNYNSRQEVNLRGGSHRTRLVDITSITQNSKQAKAKPSIQVAYPIPSCQLNPFITGSNT